MSFKQTSPLLQSIFFSVFALCLFSSETYAQCTVGNTVGNNDPENEFFWAQSFTAECTGTLEYIEFITGNDGGTQPATTLKIFEGESVTVEPIYTQKTQEMTFNGAGERLRVILNEGLPVTQGQKYTFEMQVFVNLQISTSNPYPGGIAFENGTAFEPVDFVFNIQVAEALGVEEISFGRLFEVYPNPVNNYLNIATELAPEALTVTIQTVTGNMLFKREISSEETRIDTGSLTPGVYFAIIENATERTPIRFIKN